MYLLLDRKLLHALAEQECHEKEVEFGDFRVFRKEPLQLREAAHCARVAPHFVIAHSSQRPSNMEAQQCAALVLEECFRFVEPRSVERSVAELCKKRRCA